jgi:ABC-type branched-subunit amino acid transport system ATPase component/branched-subunit amino acid ABC-type transport system permease component
VNVLSFGLLGLGLGAIYAIFGTSIVVTYKGSGVLNFATGAIGMVGAYICFGLSGHGLPLLLSMLAGLVVSAAIGVLMQVVIMRHLRSAAATTRIVATLGLMAALSALGDRVWAPDGQTEGVTAFLPVRTVTPFGNIGIGLDHLCIAGIAVVLTVVLAVLQKRTRVGLATNAVAESSVVPALMGWSPVWIGAISWAVGSATAAIGAILVADISGLSVPTLTLLVVPGLAASLLGGFESLYLTLVGGLVIGVGESEVSHYVSNPGWTTAAPLIAILAVLLVRGRNLPRKSESAVRLPRVTPGRLTKWTAVACGLGVLVIALASDIWIAPITISLIFGLIALSLVLVTGYTGQISLAQFALAGIGALFTVLINVELGWPLWLAIVAGTVLTVPVGLIVAVAAVRARGSELAVATLALATVITDLVLSSGAAIPSVAESNLGTLSIFGIDLSPITSPRQFAYLVLAIFAVAGVVTARLRRSATGLRFLAVRGNERAAASLGIDVPRTKLLAFALGSALAGLAGGLIEAQFNVGDFSQFTVPTSINVVLNSVLGGIGWVSGAAIAGSSVDAGAVFHLISTWVDPSDWLDLAVGASVLLVVVQQPDGVAPFNIELARRLSARRASRRGGPRAAKTGRQGKQDSSPRGRESGGSDRTEHDSPADRGIVPVAVSTSGLCVRFGQVLALDSVSLSVEPGEVLGVIGSNGAGKSTLIEAICGYERPVAGSVLLDRLAVDKLSPARRAKRGVVRSFQSIELFEDLTVWENIAVAVDPGGVGRRLLDILAPGRYVRFDAAWRAITQFRLADQVDMYPSQLNHAARRVVGIARAFAASPRVLLLDEPAAGLDPHERAQLGREIRRLVDSWGIAVILVEHDVDFVFGLCDRVVALDFGRVVATGSPAAVRVDRQVRAAYLGTSDLTAGDAKSDTIEGSSA